jgi:beta-N-acetylhexosaminidase
MWHLKKLAFLAAICFFICFAEFQKAKTESAPARVELSPEGRTWAEETLNQLSLEEKVGQMLQVRYFGDYESFESKEYRQLRDELRRYHIGSVVLGLHFDASGPLRISPLAQARIANQLQRDSKLPLLVAADLERGASSRFSGVPSFPWPMAFGAVGDPDVAKRFGAITAKEARAVGIQWALAPVADVNDNAANPIINTRAFGDDPQQVGGLVAAFIHGARENGILVSAKHFPGHGDTVVDSHHGLPVIPGDLEHFQRVEFPPFAKAIEAGADSILLAHARVPALESDPGKIATSSFNIVSSVLKHQLGFNGVVVTDALEMRGITTVYGPHLAVDAVKAGDDIIALPPNLDVTFRAIVDAVRKGEIPESRIDDSVRKILQMKASVGLNQLREVDLDEVFTSVNDPQDMAFAQHVADEAVTLVRDNGKVLPLAEYRADRRHTALPSNHRVAAVLITESLESSSGREFEKELKARRPDVDIFFIDDGVAGKMSPKILNAIQGAGKVVIAAYVYHTAARQTVVGEKLVNLYGLAGPSGELLKQVLAMASEKTAVVALGSPYLIENFPQIQTYICTYATDSTSEASAVKALFGEIRGQGTLPVNLTGVAPRGFSLPWPRPSQIGAGDDK